MSLIPDCYDHIIGISRTPCAGYVPSADDVITESGVYLDEIIQLHKFIALENCEFGNDVFEIMRKSRNNAIRDFIKDGNALMSNYYQLKRKPFKGIIGTRFYDNDLTLTTDYWYGVRLLCSDVVSGSMVIRNIGALFNNTGTLAIRIYNNLNELLYSFNIDTQANAFKLTDVTSHDIELPLHSDYIENLEYFIIYKYAGNAPKNNEVYSSEKYKSRQLFYKTYSNKQFGWAEWMRCDGCKLSDTSDFIDADYDYEDLMYGLLLDAYIYCNVQDVWCHEEMDFLGNNLDMAKAYAIAYNASSRVITDLQMSRNLNRITIMEGAAMKEVRDYFNKLYVEQMDFLVENIDINQTDCFVCKDNWGFSKKHIKT